jgi:ubiquinone/menaquinone biosynthesis C-methylase UbiE
LTHGGRAQRAIGALYSWAADKFYEPVVVKRAFRVFGGDLNNLVLRQGARAVDAAGGAPILDVPVGTAYFTTQIARRHNGVIVGADYAWGMVAKAVRAAHIAGASNLAPVQADIHRLPFADGSFGAVMCANGLQVIPGLRGAVSELARVLAPRGVLLVSVLVAPIGAALPSSVESKLPTVLRSGASIAGEISGAGLTVVSFRRERLAYLMEATKI